jgi:glycosyltransferase involved in cell wall biosynthesis
MIFWRNGRYYARFKNSVEPKSVTAVIPALNEKAGLAETIRHAKANPEITEIIVVDGGSVDGSREIALQLGCRVLSHSGSQGSPFRTGAQHAKGDVVLILNAKTLIPPYAALAALNCLRDAYVVGGGFWKVVHPTRPLAFGSRFMCALRLIFAKRIAIDQGLFVRRTILEDVGGVPEMSGNEELELCRLLRKKGHMALADAIVITP